MGNEQRKKQILSGKKGVAALIFLSAFLLPLSSLYADDIYVTNVGSGEISVIDSETLAVTTTITDAPLPVTVTATPDGSHIYVANTFLDAVTVHETKTHTLVDSFVVTGFPNCIQFSPDGATGYIVNELSGTVTVIDTATNSTLSTITVGDFPFCIALTPDGAKAYVTNQVSNTVSVADTSSGTVTSTIPVGVSPVNLVLTPDGSKAYVTNLDSTFISVIDTTSDTVLTTIPVIIRTSGIAISPDGSRIYVTHTFANSVSVIDTATDTVLESFPVGNFPNGIEVSTDGSKVYVANFASGTLSVVDVATKIEDTVTVGSSPFWVAVIGVSSQGKKELAVDSLGAIIDEILGGAPGVKKPILVTLKLSLAIHYIEKSLESFETGDPNRLQLETGKRFFNYERYAVKKIKNTIKKNRISNSDLIAKLQDIVVNQILEADRIVARTAIDDAIDEGGNSHKIAQAEKFYSQGLQLTEKGIEKGLSHKRNYFPKAITAYRQAWKKAQESVGVVFRGLDHDDEDEEDDDSDDDDKEDKHSSNSHHKSSGKKHNKDRD